MTHEWQGVGVCPRCRVERGLWLPSDYHAAMCGPCVTQRAHSALIDTDEETTCPSRRWAWKKRVFRRRVSEANQIIGGRGRKRSNTGLVAVADEVV